MSERYTEVLSLVYEVVESTNNQNPPSSRIEKVESAILFGSLGKLDSLGLVSFIVEIEEKLSDTYDRNFILVNEKAMSMEKSPFRTIGDLARYITENFEGLA